MIRGTTPTHYFRLPFGEEMIQSIEIYYKQGFREVLTKTKQDCSFDGKTVTLRLSQEDTLGFKEGELVKIQVRILTPAGDSIASNIMKATVDELLSDEVIK